MWSASAGRTVFLYVMGNETFAERAEDEISTFYLTDYFCRHFERFVWQALGLDRRADMVDFVFGNYTKLVFMPQVDDAALEEKARDIAQRLDLAYEYRFCGYGDLESSIAAQQAS